MGREKIRERGERRGRTIGQEGWPGLNDKKLGTDHYSVELTVVQELHQRSISKKLKKKRLKSKKKNWTLDIELLLLG